MLEDLEVGVFFMNVVIMSMGVSINFLDAIITLDGLKMIIKIFVLPSISFAVQAKSQYGTSKPVPTMMIHSE